MNVSKNYRVEADDRTYATVLKAEAEAVGIKIDWPADPVETIEVATHLLMRGDHDG